jgi:hypothetical protein
MILDACRKEGKETRRIEVQALCSFLCPPRTEGISIKDSKRAWHELGEPKARTLDFV